MTETATRVTTTGSGPPRRLPRWIRQVAAWSGTTVVIGLGGAVGSVSRYGLSLALPHSPGGFPWATFLTNVAGCFMIGILMTLTVDRAGAHPLLRPFLGVGVLGGFTTFSTYAVETRALLQDGRTVMGLIYVVGTLAAALGSVWLASTLTRVVVRPARRRG